MGQLCFHQMQDVLQDGPKQVHLFAVEHVHSMAGYQHLHETDIQPSDLTSCGAILLRYR